LRATGELPGSRVPPFKDDNGKVKPQATRFRVWEYKFIDGKFSPTREVTLDDPNVLEISWTVHLANRKASFYKFDGEAGESREPKPRRNDGVPKEQLEIDPGSRSISGKLARGVEFRKGTSSDPTSETWPNPQTNPPIEYLGELRTDESGRLIVIGGKGISATNKPGTLITDYYNNDFWFDDISDGPVKALITLRDPDSPEGKITMEAKDGAWVIVAPPDFVPDAGHIVTLYDTLFDLAAREMDLPKDNSIYDNELKSLKEINQELRLQKQICLQNYRPSFNDDIYPILFNAAQIAWLFEPAKNAHRSVGANPSIWKSLSNPASTALCKSVAKWLRKPHTFGRSEPALEAMPLILGDEPYKDPEHPRYRLTVTHTQYAMMEQWQNGNFDKPEKTPPDEPKAPNITPAGLDRAALENCVGGPFHPGIEVGWQIRHTELYSEPFRINHDAKSIYWGEKDTKLMPGYFTRQMAVPWQSDFLYCKSEVRDGITYGWWPAVRPHQVYASEVDLADKKMVEWHRASNLWPIGREGDSSSPPSYEEMVEHFYKFGFVLRKGSALIETERASEIP